MIIGKHPCIKQITDLITVIAPSKASVLITGETGTGKELIANAIHHASTRVDRPFVVINCGALPELLAESEFFGHTKGSFTGAEKDRVGLLETASTGTVFLDEIGELNPLMQVKLLRFLESGEIRPVGSNKSFQIDVRIVCATNRNLYNSNRFRQDLLFRINTFEINSPPTP